MTITAADGAECAVLRVDLSAIRSNWRSFATPDTRQSQTAATIKADAYGLGAAHIGPALLAEGCRNFFVAHPQEGAALRTALGPAGASAMIGVYNGPTPGALPLFAAHNLIPVLNDPEQITLWRDSGGGAAMLHIDTGMNRLGLAPDAARALAAADHGLDLQLVISHLACADDPAHAMNARQLAAFRDLAALFPGVRQSLANSAGALLGPQYRLDMTRPGIGLYGGLSAPGLAPVASLLAPIVMLRDVPAGQSIGYGAAFTAPSDMRIAILALGYADGLMRAASPGFYGVLDGARAPLVGRISMDLCAVDVTHIPAARPGAQIECLGPGLLDAAHAAGTIPYEFLTRLGQRFTRIWSP